MLKLLTPSIPTSNFVIGKSMLKNTLLFSCLFGSRLYGTQTPTSDRDIKHVVLVDLDELLLGRGVKNSVKKTNNEKNTRNDANDVDEEFIPVQVFARDFLEGQTYAIELAFALDSVHAEQTFYDGYDSSFSAKEFPFDVKTSQFYKFVVELRSKFLTSNIKAMMGYVVNQASIYSFKGERLNAVRRLESIVNHAVKCYSGSNPLASLYENPEYKKLFDAAALEFPKYFRLSEYDIGDNRMKPCFFLLEKCLPFTNTLATTYNTISNLEKKYGTRSDSASQSNVDWKATMHAVRIVDEGLKLLSEHKLEFPFEQHYVDKLLAMKHGEVLIEPVKEELATKLNELKELETTTTLPNSNDLRDEFEVWLKNWMRTFYKV